MRKYIKYLIVAISLFFILENSVMATTIIETTGKDKYDTIQEGSMLIGVTKFESDIVLTAARVAKAGANDATLYAKKNNGVDGYEAPTIYVYYGVGGWYELNDDNVATMVEDENLINSLSNKEIYYVNNVEKKIEVETEGIKIDEDKLPKGVSLENDKLIVNATLNNFTVYTTDNKEVKFVNEKGAFIIDNSVCYVSENGYITGYNDKCIGNVVIPEELNGEKITGVKENAFNNKGITSVEINKNIMHLENNAFANNSLTSVVIKEKYDKTDFTTYGNNVFGDFSEDKIIYDNDLVRLLNLINDNQTLKVKKGLELNKYDIAGTIIHNETSRLNMKKSKDGLMYYIYDSKKYHINYCTGIENYSCYNLSDEEKNNIGENEFNIMISLEDNQSKFVSKKVTYEIEEVEVTDEKVNNASKEIEAYLKYINEEIFKGNYNVSLWDYNKIEEIIEKNNLSYVKIGWGDGEGGHFVDITENVYFAGTSGIDYMLFDGEVLIDQDFFVELYSALGYDFKDEETVYNSCDELFENAIAKFNKDINLENYEISGDQDYYLTFNGTDANGNYMVSLGGVIIDKNTQNNWLLDISGKVKEFSVEKKAKTSFNGKQVDWIYYDYYPNISYDDYASLEEFETVVKEKVGQKFNISDFSDYVESTTLSANKSCSVKDGKEECEYLPSFADKYLYVMNFYPKNLVDGKIISYNVNVYKPLESEQETIK